MRNWFYGGTFLLPPIPLKINIPLAADVYSLVTQLPKVTGASWFKESLEHLKVY